VTMDSSIATEEQDDVSRIGRSRHSDTPVDYFASG
jgi:hypothetical protein